MCPGLPFSFCSNVLITLLFTFFLPLIVVLTPLVLMTFYAYESLRKFRNCYFMPFVLRVLCWLLLILVLIPLAVGVGYPLFVGFSIVPLYYYSVAHLVRLLIVGFRTKL